MSETVSNNIDVKPNYLEIMRNAFAEYLPHKREIPFIIQLLNWDKIPEDFKDNIKQKYFILQE
ncbi:MAG: hypothetical protein KGO93_07705 [Cyanobacteria bacterium REEB446]|nr:hypothetical protein [Cyanobacteria bacterium REEB446]